MIITKWALRALVGLVLFVSAGCVGTDRSVTLAEAKVSAIPAGDSRFVPPDTLMQAMLQAGFTREQILEDGPEVASQLARVGGAQVRYGKTTAALFAIHGNTLYISSSTHGTFSVALAPVG
jgi:hypothetical protein